MASLTERRHASAIRELERAEKKLVAAFARWRKLRVKVARYDARADRKNAFEYDQFASYMSDRLEGGK
jgi:hypothetical protein